MTTTIDNMQHQADTVAQLITQRPGSRPTFLKLEKTDQLIDVVLRLAMEVSVIRDRLDIHEALLNDKGLSAEDIETFVADESLEQARNERRQRLIQQIIEDLK